MNQRLLAAYHESGHAVCSLVLDNCIAEIEIGDDGGGRCLEGPPVGLDSWTKSERFYIVTCAYCLARERTQFDDWERAALWRITEKIITTTCELCA